jgi:uncharacterized membrane protein
VPRETAAPGIQRDSAEFARVVGFSDAIFAIAMTLLVLEIGVDALPDANSGRDMLDALADALPEIVSFAVSFWVIGRYWLAHHWFFARIERIDRRLLSLNLLYLGFVAFLPFPTGLIGDYEGNPVAFTLFALAMAAVSLMEIVLGRHAHRAGLLRPGVPAGIARWTWIASGFPVAVFVLSIPIGLVNTTAAILSWFVLSPIGYLTNRRMPRDVVSYFTRY